MDTSKPKEALLSQTTNPVNTAVQGLIGQVAGALSGLSPFAKAIVPGVAGLVGSLVTMVFTGSYDWPSIEVAGVGVVASLVTYVVPNLERKSAPVAPVAPVAPIAPAPATPPSKPAA